jgi:altronate hydrolase
VTKTADTLKTAGDLTCLLLRPEDTVAVATAPVPAGSQVRAGQHVLTVRDDVPQGHKVAVGAVASGAPVLKYGQVIGVATRDIGAGEHVHTHNLAFAQLPRDYSVGSDVAPVNFVPPAGRATFQGFVRADGRVATRNYIGVLTSVNCSATVARMVANAFRSRPELLGAYPNVDGVVALTHGSGCGMAGSGEGFEILRRTLAGYAQHPNFAGVIVLGLGCEVNEVRSLVDSFDVPEEKGLSSLTIQGSGGTRATVQAAVDRAFAMAEVANQAVRSTVPASELVLGLECGGSDGYSGITANPALGVAADLLVAQGGTAILGETPEIYGAEHLLTRRAVSPAVAEDLLARVQWWEQYVERYGASLDNNPSPGNKDGGLTTILEKSLGAVAKGGSTPLTAVYEYAQPVTQKGFVFMDTPGYDPVSVTGMVAGGANIACFTTGRGSVFGSKPAPCIKLATNSQTYAAMEEDMDVNCGAVMDGDMTVAEVGKQVFDLVLEVASGRRSKSEELGFGDEEFTPWQLGAVL